MRLRQIWKDNKLAGLKLDKSSQEFIKLNQHIVNSFIDYINSQTAPSPDKPSRAQCNLYKQA